jgi:hypothetical protein
MDNSLSQNIDFEHLVKQSTSLAYFFEAFETFLEKL